MKRLLVIFSTLIISVATLNAQSTMQNTKKNFSNKVVITPLPVLIIATYDANGNPDAMNAAWGGQCGGKHITFELSAHQTTENIRLKKAFTVSFADKKHVVESDYFGVVSAKQEPNKIAKAGMTVTKSKFVDAPRIEMIIVQEIGKAQLHAGVFLKGSYSRYQASSVAIGGPDVIQYILGRLFLQLDIAALRRRYKAVLDLPGQAARGVGEKRSKLVLKVILSIRLADKVENGQALFILCQPQATTQLLQENRQRFCRSKEQDGVNLRNVNAFVIDIHDEDKTHLAGNETILRAATFFIRRLTGQEHGRNAMLIEIPAHELRVIHRDTEAQALNIVNVCHIFQQRGHNQIRTPLSYHAAQRVDLGQLGFIITTSRPFQLVQIHGIGHTEILEGAQELAINGLWQANLCRNAVVEVAENAFAVHSFRRGSQSQKDLRLIVFQQLLISWRGRVVELVHDDVIIEIRRGLFRKVLAVKGLDGHKKMVDAVRPIFSNEHIAEIGISQHCPEGVQALFQNLFPVGNEQQTAWFA